jgi:LDH2 family malate/lactate/ureidoglycolate dehydrogenase
VGDIQIAAGELKTFANAALRAAGADAPSADGCARALLHASLHGVDSHGIRLLPFYVDCLKSGLVKGAPNIAVTKLRAAAAQIDADGGLGHAPTYRAVEAAGELAKETGIGLAAVLHSTHFGAAGAYALAGAEVGFHCLVVCNSGAFVAPFHGAKALHGTNPIAYAAPAAPGSDPFLLDMATSAIPWNRLLLSRSLKQELPPDVAVDAQGNYTTDPEAGQILAPLGGPRYGYKGAGLAGMISIMSAALTGMRLDFDQDGTALGDTELGHIVIAIDPGLFGNAADAGERVAAYIRAAQAHSGDGRMVQAAGGPQWRHRAERDANGIPIPAALHAELNLMANGLGLNLI